MRLLQHLLLGIGVACVLVEIVCVAVAPGALSICMFLVTLMFLAVNFMAWSEG